MKTRVPNMPLTTPDLHPVEAERGGIHLVPPPVAISSRVVVAPKIGVVRTSSRKSEHIRESEKMSTLALASAALLAPIVWIGHAILVWLDIF